MKLPKELSALTTMTSTRNTYPQDASDAKISSITPFVIHQIAGLGQAGSRTLEVKLYLGRIDGQDHYRPLYFSWSHDDQDRVYELSKAVEQVVQNPVRIVRTGGKETGDYDRLESHGVYYAIKKLWEPPEEETPATHINTTDAHGRLVHYRVE